MQNPGSSAAQDTADNAGSGGFGLIDWVLLLSVACIWGSSFLWIAIGLETFPPTTVAFLRLALGAGVLWMFPPAWTRVGRDAWPAILIVGIAGNALPSLLFALAQQRVESSVAGMINAATPLAVLVGTVFLTRKKPMSNQSIGLLVGFVGIVLMASPSLQGADAEPLGIAMLLLAVSGYGWAYNVIAPIQQRYGSTPIIARALLAGSLVCAPFGAAGLVQADPSLEAIFAMAFLGILGTGIARSLNASLTGRVGATRSSLVTYVVPVIAIALGIVFRGETVSVIEVFGTALILGGAYLTSRRG